MRLGVRSYFLVGVFAFVALPLTGVPDVQTEGRVSIEYSTPRSFTLNEPVMIQMSVRNGLKETVNVDLGADYKTNLILRVVQPDGSSIQPPQFILFGMGRSFGKLSIRPDQTYSQEVLLDEWYKPVQVGRYQVEIKLTKPIQRADGTTLETETGGKVAFQVGPRDVNVLNNHCGQLLDKVLHGQSDREKADAALVLSYVTDPVAVPYLAEALKHSIASTWANGGYLGVFAIDGLVRIRNAEAVEILRSNRDTSIPALKAAVDCGLTEIKTGMPCRAED